MIKGLVVDSSKHFVLKENLTFPLVGQDEVLVKVKSASVSPFDAQRAHGRFDAYFAGHEVVK
jgi:D-arabinose 1-dehydrogenase-like Zn-dependent alcohol dehydrogenase